MKAQNGTTTCKETPSEPSKYGEGEACLPKFVQNMINLDPTATCGWNNDTMLLKRARRISLFFFLKQTFSRKCWPAQRNQLKPMQSVVKQWELRSSRMPERVRPCHRCGSKANTITKGTGLAPLVEYGWGHEFVLMQMFVLPVRHCRFQNRGVRDRGKTSVTFSSALLWRMQCFFDEGSLEVLVADLTTFGRFYGPMGSLTNRCADCEFLATSWLLYNRFPNCFTRVLVQRSRVFHKKKV